MRLFVQIKRFVAISGLCLATLACSLGTEVGNGFKPSKGDDNQNKIGATKSSPDSLFSSTSESQIVSGLFDSSSGFASSAVGEGASAGYIQGYSDRNINDTRSIELPKGTGGGVQVGGTTPTEDFVPSVSKVRSLEFAPIDSSQFQGDNLNQLLVDLALTGCASPLYDVTPSSSASFSLTLSGGNRLGQVRVTAGSDSRSWSIRSSELLIDRNIELSPTIKVTSSGGSAVPSYSSCSARGTTSSAVLADYSGTFNKTTYKLATSRGYTYLTWYLKDGPGDFITRLKRIELNKSPGNSDPFVVISAP